MVKIGRLKFVFGLLLTITLAGCRTYTDEVTNDTLWINGQFSTVINRQHRDRSLGSHSLGGGYDPVVANDWKVVVRPLPATNMYLAKPSFWFLKMEGGGDQEQQFSSIGGSDLLVHQFGGDPALFDPKVGKDISKLFPPSAEGAHVFNRSRTKCLISVRGTPVIFDTLSAREESSRILSQPPWERQLEECAKHRLSLILTEDGGYLLSCNPEKHTTNLIIDVWSTNSTSPYFTIPIKWIGWGPQIIGAESVNGNIVVLTKTFQSNGWEDLLEVVNAKGETVHSINSIASKDFQIFWDPFRHEVYIPNVGIWDYESKANSDTFVFE